MSKEILTPPSNNKDLHWISKSKREMSKTTVQITHIRDDAFFTCDCKKEVMLSKRYYNSESHTGSCICGIDYELIDRKLFTKTSADLKDKP